MPDQVQAYLDSLNTSNAARKAAWDALSAQSDEEARAQLDKLPFSKAVKHNLWELAAGRTADQETGITPSPAGSAQEQTRVRAGTPPELYEQPFAENVPPSVLLNTGMVMAGAPGMARALTSGVGLTGKAVAVGKEAVSQSTPIVKYEATKAVLDHIGIPSSLSVPLAIAVSGYRPSVKSTTGAAEAIRGAAKTAEAEMPVAAARAESAASAPAVQAARPSPAVEAPTPGRTSGSTPSPLSPQRIRNEVGLAARRQNLKLTEEQYAVAERMVAEGHPPMDSVKLVHAETSPLQTQTSARAKPRISATEMQEYIRLRSAGKSEQEATEAILSQRKLAQRLGTPSVETARARVAERNATGRWQ